MIKKNVVSVDTTKCSASGCSNGASCLGLNDEPVCKSCASFAKQASSRAAVRLNDLGSSPELIKRHGDGQ